MAVMEDSMPVPKSFSIQFLGVGGAFSMPTTPGDLTTCPMQSNMVITAGNGKRMLFDCGTDIRLSAQMCGFGPASFDAVYISHEHADHAGGLEWLLLNRLFGGGEKPLLIAESDIGFRLWATLRSSLKTTTKGLMRFEDYVKLQSVICEPYEWVDEENVAAVTWEDIPIKLVRNIHVHHEKSPMASYGMILDGRVYISSDTVFDPFQIEAIAAEVEHIFHDCEVGFKTGVHAHYDELLTLPKSVRAKMWLYHYNPVEAAKKDVLADGFRGFVTRGQTFKFT